MVSTRSKQAISEDESSTGRKLSSIIADRLVKTLQRGKEKNEENEEEEGKERGRRGRNGGGLCGLVVESKYSDTGVRTWVTM